MIFVVTIAGSACVRGDFGRARPADRPANIQLSTWAGLLRSISVTVAGATHPFIFDTGGGETMLSPEVASAVGCVPYGRAIGLRAGGEQVAFEYCDDVWLRLGDIAIAHERVGVFDLKSVLPAGLPPADGVVSLRSFRGQPVTIDLATGRITVETADSLIARTSGMRPLTIRVASGPTGAPRSVRDRRKNARRRARG
ncbi:MAG: aspartyl protease family protein [Acidobacteria bacterium]|nr:aspartyl protease family protein [Acidobacteriota bacterium]